MEMTTEFVQYFVNKLQTEVAEGTKQRMFLSAQVEYMTEQLENFKKVIEDLGKERDDLAFELKSKEEILLKPEEDKEHEELKKEWGNVLHPEKPFPVKTLPLTQ